MSTFFLTRDGSQKVKLGPESMLVFRHSESITITTVSLYTSEGEKLLWADGDDKYLLTSNSWAQSIDNLADVAQLVAETHQMTSWYDQKNSTETQKIFILKARK